MTEPAPTRVGRYRVLDLIGAGGMGEVYAGHDPLLDRLIAIKRLRPERVASNARREQIRHEARLHASLRDPNIVTVYDFVTQLGIDHIVSEYVEGSSLRELTTTARPSLERALELFVDVADGLHYAHRNGVVHRDLKTENVIVDADGRAKLTDFGIAHLLGQTGAPRSVDTSEGPKPVGTPRTMSPEQSLAMQSDPRSDLFSFGVLMYEVVAGVSPFEGRTPDETLENIRSGSHRPLAEWSSDIPQELSTLVDGLLAKDARDRPRSAGEVALRLRELQARQLDLRRRASVTETVERRQLAVLYLRVEPVPLAGIEEAVERLAAEFRSVRERVAQLRASITGAGKELVVCIGYPGRHDNNSETAAELALELTRRSAASSTAVALDVGEVFIANGSDSPLFAGPPVDAAVALGRDTPAGRTFVTARAHALLSRRFRLEQNHSSSARVSPAYELMGLRSVTTDGDAPLVGRESELATLLALWKPRPDRRGIAIALVGEAGIGKSRLLWEFVRARDPQGLLVVSGAPGDQFRPFAALRPLVEQSLGVRLDGAADPRRELATAADAIGLSHEHVAAICHACAIDDDSDRAWLDALPSRDRAQTMQERLADVICRVAERSPVVLVVEDVHWVDYSSLQVFQLLVQLSREHPVSLLFTQRPEWRYEWQHAEDLVELPVARLSEAQSREVVERIAASRALAAQTIEGIVRRSEGIPLLLEELTRGRVEGPQSQDARPLTSLRDSVLSRAEQLADPLRELLELAATMGRELDTPLLARAGGLDPAECVTQLDVLRRRGFLVSPERSPSGTYAFGHILTRDAIHGALDRGRRVALHLRLLAELSAGTTDDRSHDDRWLERLAHHTEGAEQTSRAIELRIEAARRASARWAHGVARANYERALQLLAADESAANPRIERDIRDALSFALVSTEGWGARVVEDNAARLQQLVTEAREELPWTALWQQWAYAYVVGKMDLVSAAFGELEARVSRDASAADALEERELVRYLLASARGATYLQLGLLESAREHLVAAARYREPVSDALASFPQPEACIVPGCYLAWTELLLGEATLAWHHQTTEEHRARHSRLAQLCAISFGVALALAGHDWAAAEERIEIVLGEGRSALAPQHVQISLLAREAIGLHRRADSGDVEDAAAIAEAIQAMRRHFAEWESGFMRVSSVIYITAIAEACLAIVDHPRTPEDCRAFARAQCREALDWALERATGPDNEIHGYLVSEVHRLHAVLLAAEGRRDVAVGELVEAQRHADRVSRAAGRPARLLELRIRESASRV